MGVLFSNERRFAHLIVLTALLPMAACIAHAPGSQNQNRIEVSVTSSAGSPATVPVSMPNQPTTIQYTASVTGTGNTDVTWSLAAASNLDPVCTATGDALGTFVVNGNNSITYTAPTDLPLSPCGVAVTATSNADHETIGQALVKVTVAVVVSPANDTIGQTANLLYTAKVYGAPSDQQDVTWSTSCAQCNGTQQKPGAFDPGNSGLYVAPQLDPGVNQLNVEIDAHSSFDKNNQPGATNITVLPSDPRGTANPSTATAAQISCPAGSGGLSNATCYKLSLTCDAIADYSAYLKVNKPLGQNLGTVIFASGSGSAVLYDNDINFISGSFNGGLNVVQGILSTNSDNDGYTTVQVSFGAPFDNSSAVENGWLQGPGGVRRLACRFATVVDWINKNIHNSTTLPMCGTGNSAGASAFAYAATAYGLASEFSLLELTGGPVMTRIDKGCSACSQFTAGNTCTDSTEFCYSVSSGGSSSTAGIIDAAYQGVGQTSPTLCTNGVNGDETNFNRFTSDSIESASQSAIPLSIPDPPTQVRVILGGLDATTAPVQSYSWVKGVNPQPPAPACLADASHAIPAVSDGAAQIVSDIQTLCKVH